jgi:Ca-activated chloride channel homolog
MTQKQGYIVGLVVVVGVVGLIMFDRSTNGTASFGIDDVRCAEKYEQLLAANAFDFSDCTTETIREGEYEDQNISVNTHIVVMFDSSGSMAGTVADGRKIDVAKEALSEFAQTLEGEEKTKLSLVVYGHKGNNEQSGKSVSCAGIEEVYSLGDVRPAELSKSVSGINPTGWTPIADSLTVSGDILSRNPADVNVIIVVSDGEETCGGDPVAVAETLREGKEHIITSVIGFDVAGEEDAALRDIAYAGGGSYESVSTLEDLKLAFKQHRNFLSKADYTIGRIIEQVYDMNYVVNTYNQCTMALRREEAAMMLDIHVSKLVGTSCEAYAETEYRKHFESLMTQFEQGYLNAKKQFEAITQ